MESNLIYWIFFIIIILILMVVTIGIILWIRNERASTPQKPQYQNYSSWGNPVPSQDPTRNTCQLYQFPSGNIMVDSKEFFTPGNPTFNSNIINMLTGKIPLPSCLDIDQIVAQQMIRECVGPTGAVTPPLCRELNGAIVEKDSTEIIYSNNLCRSIPLCDSILSTVSLNYHAPQHPFYCLVQNNGFVETTLCNMGSEDQQFRISRINPFNSPNQGSKNVGLLAKIQNRQTSFCLNANLSIPSQTMYNPSFSNNCPPGPIQPVNGNQVTLENCDLIGPTGFAGYDWLLLPGMSYIIPPNQNKFSPQQIIFLNNKDPREIPLYNGTGYQNYTGSYALIKWLQDNQLPSLFWGGQGNNPIVHYDPAYFDGSTCQGKSITAQYLPYPIYNTISSQKSCVTSISDCVNF